jgi:hypothetical protein
MAYALPVHRLLVLMFERDGAHPAPAMRKTSTAGFTRDLARSTLCLSVMIQTGTAA